MTLCEREVLLCFAIRLQTQEPADQKKDGDQEHAEYSHSHYSQMDWTKGFRRSSLMILWSDYCAADLRVTVTCNRTNCVRLGLNGRGMKVLVVRPEISQLFAGAICT
jgi:hypothetical protein